MRQIIKNKKKKGFTLIEMVAVVAIIGILAAILVPKITGYLSEAKKTAVIDQARKVAQAYEAAQMKGTIDVKGGTPATLGLESSLSDVDKANSGQNIQGNTTMKSLLDGADLSKLGTKTDVKMKHCLAITKGSDFQIDAKTEVLKLDTVDVNYASK